MKMRVLSVLVALSMVLSMLGTTLPVFGASQPTKEPVGQTWYINGDINSGDAFTSLTTSPNTPVHNQDTYAWGMSHSLSTPVAISFPAGDWVVRFTIATPIVRTLTFSIKRRDATTGWSDQVLQSQVVNLNNNTWPSITITVDLIFSLPAFTLTPSGDTPGSLSMWWQEGSSRDMTIVYGGTNSYLQTPAGSPLIPCRPYSTNPTVTNIQATTATFSATIPYIGSYSDTSVQFKVTRNGVWDSFFFNATPSPVTSGGTVVSVNATGLPAGSSYYFYPIIYYGGGLTSFGKSSADFSTPALPKYTLTVAASPAAGGSVTLDPPQPVGGYNAGTPVQLTPAPSPGWTFGSWNGALTGTANPGTIVMDGNKNVTANFWQVETVDQIDSVRVGDYTSLVLDDSNNPHISYNSVAGEYASTNVELRYAYFGGSSWQTTIVDSTDTEYAGFMTSLALDSSGRPHIAYISRLIGGVNKGILKYAFFDGSTWHIETVDSQSDADMPSLALDSANRPHISYQNATASVYDLKYAYFDTSWHITTVDIGYYNGTTPDTTFGWTGAGSSLAIDSADNPHISYIDYFGLWYASFNGTSWQKVAVDSVDNAGWGTSLVLDSTDKPHISYTDVTNYDLKYAFFDGSSWQKVTANIPATDQPVSPSLALDSSNRPHISYSNGTYDEGYPLKYAHYDGTNWQVENVALGLYGTRSSLALDVADNPHISFYSSFYSNLKYASKMSNPLPLQYTLTTTVSPAGGGTITRNLNQALYNSGTTVQLTPHASEGYTFANWSGDLTGSAIPGSILMDGNKNVTAVFAQLPPPPVLNPANGHYYEVVPVPPFSITWDDANAAAQAKSFNGMPGHLVTITSAEEQQFLFDNGLAVDWAWIGGFQPGGSQEPDGNWQWVTGEPWDYTNWESNPLQPDNGSGQGAENVLNFYSDRGTWNDMPGSTPQSNYVVEYELPPSIFNPVNGHYYELVTIPAEESGVDWDTAKSLAESKSYESKPGHLVTITTQAETDFLTTNNLLSSNAWIGGFQADGSQEPAGGWQWVTGEPWDYTNWNTGEPNNNFGNPPPEDALQTWPYSPGFWNDAPRGTLLRAFIVEYEPPPTKYTLTITTAPVAGGSVTLDPIYPVGGYNSGTTVTLTPHASAGYTFANWTGGLTGSANPGSILMNGNKNVTANFTQAPPTKYTLTITTAPVAGGSVTLDPPQPVGGYNAGTTVTLTPHANAGYTFTNWTGNLTGSANPGSIVMNGNKTVTATFTQQPQGDGWTFIVYMAADNNLNDAAIDDINEMELVGSSDKVNIVALLDLYGNNNTTAYYIVKDENVNKANIVSTVFNPAVAWTWGNEANTGNPGTLTEFINKTIAAYPAEHYAVILWNHGNGIRAFTLVEPPKYKWIALDETSGNSYLDISELSGALDLVNAQQGGQPLGVVGFDACLMEMAEIAFQLVGNAHMMVGSEEVVPADGFPYDTILADLVANPAMTCRQLSEAIVTRYAEAYPAPPYESIFTMSAIDLMGTFSPGMGQISLDINALADSMVASGEWDSIFAARTATEWFDDPDYVDLKHFAQNIKAMVTDPAVKAAAQDLIDSLTPTVFANFHGAAHPSAGGLSIYMPIAGSIDPVYQSLQFISGSWDEFLVWYLSQTVEEPTQWTEVFADPQGDQFFGTGPDIAGVDKALVGNSIFGRVRSFGTIDYSNFQGATLLDVDQDQSTGTQGDGPLGFDFLVYVTAGDPPPKGAGANIKSRVTVEPWAALLKYSGNPLDPWTLVAMIPLFADIDSYWSMIPLALLDTGSGPDDGQMNVFQVFATKVPDENTDIAPDKPLDWRLLIDDPPGDVTNPKNDITRVEGFRHPDKVGFRVHIQQAFDIDNFTGSVWIDIDQKSTTGLQNSATNDIGIEYRVTLTSPPGGGPLGATLYHWNGTGWDTVGPVNFATTVGVDSFFDIFIELTDLGNDEGNMDFTFTVPDKSVPSPAPFDVAPDTGHGSFSEPPWKVLFDDNPPGITGLDYFSRVSSPCEKSGSEQVIGFRVRMADTVDFANLLGQTLLDVDRDPATGKPGVYDIGIDYTAQVTSGAGGVLQGVLLKWNSVTLASDPIAHFGVFTGIDPLTSTRYYWFGLRIADLLNPDGTPEDGFMDVVQGLGTAAPPAITEFAPPGTHASIAPKPLPEVLEDGLAWLVSKQLLDGSADNGSWGSTFKLAETALAVYKLETDAWKQGIDPLSDAYIYKANVIAGLDYIIANGHTIDISAAQPHQPAAYVDNTPVGVGVLFHEGAGETEDGFFENYQTYNTSISLLAIAAAKHPARTVNKPGNPLNGMTYDAIIKNAVDYLAWGQTDYGVGRGGWNYGHSNAAFSRNDRSDQSNTGWVTIALAAAEDAGVPIPGWVRNELELWVGIIQDPPGPAGDDNDGGAHYDGPVGFSNGLRTGNLLQQFAFLGDTTSSPRVQAALDYLARHWTEGFDQGWRGCPDAYQATYTIMKGLEALGITTFGSPSIDWFSDFVKSISVQQMADGGWPQSPFDAGDRVLSTTWALLTLEKEIPPTREGPDLVITGKHEEWLNQAEGKYKIVFTIKNIGNLPATDSQESPHKVSLVIDENAPILIPIPLQGLQPGASFEVTLGSTTTPFILTGGEDTIIIGVDATDVIAELNEDNNYRKNGHPARTDLAITSKKEEWVGEPGPTGGAYQVLFTLKNVGNTIIPAGHEVGLFIDDSTGPVATMKVWHPMLPGEEISGGFGFSSPFQITGGSDTIRVGADYADVIEETNNTNNWFVNTLRLPGVSLPDLVIRGKWEIQVAGPAGTYSVNFLVQNIGNAPLTGGFDVAVTIDQNTPIIVTFQGDLPVDGYLQGQTPPIQLSEGSDTILVTVDPNEQILELEEENNSRSNTYPPETAKPDLIVLDKSEKWAEGSDTDYSLTFILANVGQAPVELPFNVGVFVDGVLTVYPIEDTFMPGQIRQYNDVLTFTLSPPEDIIRVIADVGDKVHESIEGNNAAMNRWPPEQPPPAGKPDLVIRGKWEMPVQGQPGKFTVNIIIQNVGGDTAGASLADVFVNQVYVASLFVPPLPPHVFAMLQSDPISLLPGAVIRVVADAGTEVAEIDENNNTRENTLTAVPLPDLIIIDKWENWLPQSQTQYTVSYLMINVGAAPAVPPFKVGIYQNGNLLGHILYAAGSNPLMPGQPVEQHEAAIVTLGANPPDEIEVRADADNQLPEADETNNSMVNFWPQQGPPPGGLPDLIISEKHEQWVTGQEGVRYIVYFTVKNIGAVPVPSQHKVGLVVDGNPVGAPIAVPVDLAPDQTWQGEFPSVAINGGSDEITVIADVMMERAESNEGNNELDNIFPSQTPAPDLVITEKHETWVNQSAKTYKVYFTVKNTGNLLSNPFHVGVKINNVLQTEKRNIANGLQPNEELILNFDTVFIMSGSSDNIEVIADVNTVVTESNEGNNSRPNTFNAPAMADLIVLAKHEEWSTTQPGFYTVFFTIKNQGGVAAPSPFTVQLFVDSQPAGTITINNPLNAGATLSDSFAPIQLNGNSDVIRVVVDYGQTVAETNEGNNFLENILNKPLPDLTVLEKAETWFDKENGIYRITAVIKNLGPGDAPTTIPVRFSIDGVSQTVNHQIEGTSFPADSFFDIFVEVTMEGDADVIEVTVDPLNAIPEADENNNSLENTLNRLKPDLIISAKSEPWVQGQAGIKYTVNFTVKNIGEVTAPAQHLVLLTIDGIEQEFVSVPVDLAPQGTWSGSFGSQIVLSDGSDEVQVRADFTGYLAEANEQNNNRTNIKSTNADIRIVPSTQTVGVNQIFSVQIWVDASLREIDTIQTYLDFDTSVLKVVDAAGNVLDGRDEDAITSGVIVLGETADFGFPDRNKKIVDNSGAVGRIDLALGVGTGGFPVNENFLLATIRFKALQVTDPDVTHLLFQTTDELRTTRAIRDAIDVTGTVSDGDINVIAGVQVVLGTTLQRSSSPPSSQWVTPMRVWIHQAGAAWDAGAANYGAALYVETSTNSQGKITVVIPPGIWDIRVKGKTSLKVLKRNVSVAIGMGEVNMGILYEGDTNDDNVIDGVDYSTVVMCYGTSTNPANATYLPQSPWADFNNDGVVEGLDYSRLLGNFLKKGADIP